MASITDTSTVSSRSADSSAAGSMQPASGAPFSATGNRVTCRAQVLRSEDNQFHFKLEAFDEHEKIASGLHKLAVIDKSRLARRVERKRK